MLVDLSLKNFEDLVSWITTTAAALIGKWHVSKQSMTQPLVSFWLLFLVHFFSIDLEIIAFFFQSDFFSARLGIALEVGRQKKKFIQNREEALLLYAKKIRVLRAP